MFSQYLSILKSRPWLTTIFAILLVGGISIGDQYLAFSGNYRVFFDSGDKRVTSYDNIQSVYSQSDNILMVVSAKNGVFTAESLSAIRELTESSWTLPHVSRVDSITNFQNTETQGDDLIVADLVGKYTELNATTIHHIQSVANAEPNIKGLLLSADNHTTGINITVQLPGENAEELPSLVVNARALANQFRSQHPELELRLAGEIMLTNAFIEATIHDFTVLTPLMFLVVIIVFLLVLRSILGTIIGVVFSALSIKGAMGAAGWTGMMLTPPTAVAPTIVLTIAVATFIHVYITFSQRIIASDSRLDAVLDSIKLNFKPITLTCLTTIIGFLSMNFSTVPPFRDLGNVIAFGVVFTYFLSLTFLPAILIILPHNKKRASSPFQNSMRQVGDWVVGNHRILLIGSVICGVGLTSLVANNQVSEKFIEQFSHRIEFRNSAEYVNDNLTGVYNIEYSINSGETAGVYDPLYMQSVDDFTQWLRAQDQIVHVRSFTDTLKRLNKNLNQDDASFYRLPQDRESIAQAILMYEMSLPYGLGISDQLSLSKSSSRLVVTFGNLSTKEVLLLEDKIARWAHLNMPEYSLDSGSPTLMFSHIGDANVRGMLIGTAIAFVLIALFLTLFFRSIKFGALSMIVNFLPITSAFGIWAILVGEVGMGVSVVAGMTIGVVVDDTVHFINKYLYARRQLSMNPEDAVRYCFNTVGVAILCTTVILACGFLVICFSDFARNSSMAQMNVITITLALVYDFIFLPSIILLMEKLFNENVTDDSTTAPYSTANATSHS
jgi:predicted RND superfamily exporter protein